MASYNLSINGKTYKVEADPKMPLLWVIRELAGLHGTKYGCGMAQCGACTVHLNGNPVRSCITHMQFKKHGWQNKCLNVVIVKAGRLWLQRLC
jgi:aerobic-type carbon monoxide dehydrogenase small subunit (CoxS/CutS family)